MLESPPGSNLEPEVVAGDLGDYIFVFVTVPANDTTFHRIPIGHKAHLSDTSKERLAAPKIIIGFEGDRMPGASCQNLYLRSTQYASALAYSIFHPVSCT
jgi:hypothetical protein